MGHNLSNLPVGRLAAIAILAAAVLACCWSAPALSRAEDSIDGAAIRVEPAAGDQVSAAAEEEIPIPTKNVLQVIRDGGVLMLPIAGCSLILMAFIFERAIALRRGRVIPRPFVKRFLKQLQDRQLNRERAVELCEQNNSPVAEVFGAAIKKWGRSSVEVEQAILDQGERTTNSLRRYLRLFNGVATVTPLLGLLGTVLGMISAFNAIATADAMGRPELLAAGISQALLTTAAGLSVAIPAFIAYLYFVSRVDRLIMEIDGLGQELVSLIAADAWRPDRDERDDADESAGQTTGRGKRSSRKKAA
ncbi:MAG: MotA/TolQ/ExbB proton channel family protein [Pirellulaceae bacterium]|jgi:biopolymer transport protein ExbB|nr:MotA/TolQ/ExbB proton channel family protein [Pirellulaceae bacterium]MDP7019125.1 MotA/TolQ/ExbB proton channel family protein [Pirellulaceae bacterium]